MTTETYLIATYLAGWLGSGIWFSVLVETSRDWIKESQRAVRWDTGMHLRRPAYHVAGWLLCAAWPVLLVDRAVARRKAGRP